MFDCVQVQSQLTSHTQKKLKSNKTNVEVEKTNVDLKNECQELNNTNVELQNWLTKSIQVHDRNA